MVSPDEGGERVADIVRTVVHRGGDLFDVAVVEPRRPRDGAERMPDIFNLQFRYNGRDAEVLAGGGVYAVYYQGELLYIGLFTGDRRVPFASNVASQRFYKHLEALTLRGRAIGFTPGNYDEAIALDRPDCPLIGILRATLVPRGNGAVKTYPSKVKFASDNWDAFSRIERDRSVLDGFTFVYGRIGAEQFSPDISYREVKKYVNVIEDDLIRQHTPRCNLKIARSSDGHLAIGPGRDAWISFKKLVGDHISRRRIANA
jgi:hypothetical protein